MFGTHSARPRCPLRTRDDDARVPAGDASGADRARRLTTGPLHHFFGYYGINVWDPSGRFHLALETDFHRRPPSPADTAAVGLVDRETGEFSKVSATRAFNLQQGSMLHWIDTGRGAELTHNDWDGERTVSRAIALGDRSSRIIGRAIAAVSPDGTAAMGLSYERMYHFAWQDADTLLVSTDLRGRRQFLVGHDGRDDFEPVGQGVLPDDGHACYSPDGRWIACDTYPHGTEHHSEVMLYAVTGNRKVSLGFYRSEEIFRCEIRCDLHPRWTPDGRGLTIDAVTEGDRQIHLIDVSDVVG